MTPLLAAFLFAITGWVAIIIVIVLVVLLVRLFV